MTTSAPKGGRAVRAMRAAPCVPQDGAQEALWRTLDYFATPPWAARAGAELVRAVDPRARSVWECACGEGHMADALRDYFAETQASDIYDFGYGGVLDFLGADDPGVAKPDWIVTNPPFKLAQRMTELALQRARRGVAMLCRLQWLESEGRYMLFAGRHPLTLFAPFAERVPMQLGGWNPKGRTATAYAWFIWRKGAAPRAPLIIPPGTRRRLWRAQDVRLWGREPAAPLLGDRA